MRFIPVFLATLLLTVIGCGQKAPAPQAETPPTATPAPAPPAPPTPLPVANTPPPAENPNDPAAGFRKALEKRPRPTREKAEVVITATEPEKILEQLGQAVADRKLQALWEVLPTDYQSELSGLIADFANKMDPKVWDEITSTVQLGVYTMRQHKERFFKHPVSEELPIPKESLEKAWEPMIEIGEALLDSQVYSIEDLRTFDPPAFLAKTGPAIIDNLPSLVEIAAIPPAQDLLQTFRELKGIKTERLSGDEMSATIKVTVPGSDPVEVVMLKVGDKWIPKQLQEQWPTFMQQIKDGIAVVPSADKKEELEKFKQQVGGVKLGVMILAGADSDELFDRQVRAIWKLVTREDFPVPPEGKEAAGKPADAPSEAAKPTDAKPADGEPADAKPEEQKEEK